MYIRHTKRGILDASMATTHEICSNISEDVIPDISKVCDSASTTEWSSVETSSRDSLSAHVHHQAKDTMKSSSEGDVMGEVKEENGMLKLVLSKMLKDYKSLQQHIHEITATDTKNTKIYDDDVDVVLSLGRPSSSVLAAVKINDQQKVYNKRGGGELDDNSEVDDQTFSLRLDCKHDSAAADNNNQHRIKVGVSEINNDPSQGKSEEEEPGSKDLRRLRTEEDGEQYLRAPKKARVSVRAICNAPTMNDGCQWRKYGQKIAKGNPCPRAYYRCTISPSCPVRKHVQRCPEDMSILVTTYEGSHDHPLPPSATAMASTTSAAISMLKSSSTSTSQPSLSLPCTTSTHTLNSVRPPFYLPNTTISTSQTHPTVTLDLTAPTASSRYNKYASTFFPRLPPTYNSPTNCLNFSAPSSSSSSFEYWNSLQNHNTSSLSTCNGTQIYQPLYNMPTRNIYDQAHQSQYSKGKIAAATKEITSSPSFQSALAAAVSSIVGKSGAQRMEPSLDFGYSSYLNRTSTVVPSNSQPPAGKLEFVVPLGSDKCPFVAGSSAEKGEYKKR